MVALGEFLEQPAVVGILAATPHEAAAVGYALPGLWALRAVRSAQMPTVQGVFDEFAAAWQFPYYFGANKNAFDECMRELDETAGAAPGYVVLVRDAAALLRDEPGELAWFADAMTFHAEHWAAAGASFKVLLQVEPALTAGVAKAWRAAGVEPVAVELGS